MAAQSDGQQSVAAAAALGPESSGPGGRHADGAAEGQPPARRLLCTVRCWGVCICKSIESTSERVMPRPPLLLEMMVVAPLVLWSGTLLQPTLAANPLVVGVGMADPHAHVFNGTV